MVRAKFKVTEVTHYPEDASVVKLQPVYDDNPDSENGQFYKWTPSGEIVLETVNTDAAKQFIPGKEYYVDFLPAE